ncbi:MAG: ABC transporter permease subunit [Phycisphaerales bacterium]|nr:ABC transporter permease subunit [Phycisphaerales bacterium]
MSPMSKAPTVRRTGRRVRMVDSAARAMIQAGGMAVLAAMFGIMVFLVVTVAPLFAGAKTRGPGPTGVLESMTPIACARLVNGAHHALLVTRDGRMLGVALEHQRVALEADLAGGCEVTATAFEPGRWRLTMGTRDGRILTREIDLRWLNVSPAAQAVLPGGGGEPIYALDAPMRETLAAAMNLPDPIVESAYVERTGDGRVLLWQPIVGAASEIELGSGEGAVELVHSAGVGTRRRFLAAVRADGTATYGVVRSVVRLDGGGATDRLTEYGFGLDRSGQVPRGIFVLSDGESVIVAWEDGGFSRYDARNPAGGIVLAETGRLVPQGHHVGVVTLALGSQTLLVGDETGMLSAWLVADVGEPGTSDGRRLTRRWELDLGDSPIVSIEPGDRDRSAAVALGDGLVALVHLTSEKRFASLRIEGRPVVAAASPSEELLLAVNEQGQYASRVLEPGHPGVSWRSLFGKVHYEGYADAQWVYQSTGDASSEPKYSLVPLLFGTAKATFFAMLFATPMAVMAAIYASEFMHRSIHRVVKPSIELMASLPSVVIGFVAAMVVAPFVRQWLPSIMLAMLVLPLAAVTAGMIWQLVPPRHGRKLGSRSQLAAIALVLLVGTVLSRFTGPLVEQFLFHPSRQDALIRAGMYEVIPNAALPMAARSPSSLSAAELSRLRLDGVYFVEGRAVRPLDSGEDVPATGASIERWLDGNFGRAWPGWFIAMMVPTSLIVPMLHANLFSRRWIGWLDGLSRPLAGLLEVLRLLTSIVAVIGVAALAGWLLDVLGLDPRDSIFGRFNQKNTLVVGIVMGFAVIPIIFTISEDALASVPRALRSASLGAGATPWQTAVRVVLPVAGSGIFSACMIGLGRAVGETMIVLMATGNTPEMDLNIFSGFRSLSANIAVELPEAPRDSTHFRVLFLCGLVLFVMTLAINSSAEAVRQHFRRRNAAL